MAGYEVLALFGRLGDREAIAKANGSEKKRERRKEGRRGKKENE